MITEGLRRTPRRLWLLWALLAAFIFSGGRAEASPPRFIDFIELSGVIDPVSSRYLLREISHAATLGSEAVIVRLDTPGGLDISMREIVQGILTADVPVVVWIAPQGARAASAGVFITYAATFSAMAPATNIGAAHPVDLGGRLSGIALEKATNDAAAYLRSIAAERGRNADWAEKAVRESVSLDAPEAVRMGVVDFSAGSLSTLVEKLNGRQARVNGRTVALSTLGAIPRFHKMGLVERILHTVIRPEVAYLLVLVGFYGIVFELYNPGLGAAGLLGGLMLVLGLYSMTLLPVSWAGVALLGLAITFFVADLHHGSGLLTVGGVVTLIAGSFMLFSGANPALHLPLAAILVGVATSLLFFISIMTAALRARAAKPLSGTEGMAGTLGKAKTDIAPDGQVMAKGTLWRARTLGAAIPEGAEVRIRSVAGLMLIVEPAEDSIVGEGQQGKENDQ